MRLGGIHGFSWWCSPRATTRPSRAHPVAATRATRLAARSRRRKLAPGRTPDGRARRGRDFKKKRPALASAASVEPLGVVPADGTVCVREPGTYRALVHLSGSPVEGASLVVQIWQASRD